MKKILKSILYLGAATAALAPVVTLASCSNTRINMTTNVEYTNSFGKIVHAKTIENSVDVVKGNTYTFRITILKDSSDINKINTFEFHLAESFPFDDKTIKIVYTENGEDKEVTGWSFNNNVLSFPDYTQVKVPLRIIMKCTVDAKVKPYAYDINYQ